MDGAEGASGLDQLHQFGVAGEKPLKTVGKKTALQHAVENARHGEG